MRMKAQDPISIVKSVRTHQISIPHTSKSIALIRTDVGHWKIGRKFLDLRSSKAKAELILPKEITTQEADIQIEAEVGGETKTDLCIACFTREIQTIVQETIPSS
jgi:hypothetical protein